ncbi:MAG: Holliday junction resolvase RuvX [Xanthomonadales bacterium]|jgi:putative Holliday junction resolvase|nr:Holliday junction resolvase RuvX [Xanthomonadales bacterium]
MPESAPVRGYVLSFDFGFRRIGIAIGQTLTSTATALETVSHGQKPDWSAIDRLVREWKPALLLVGLPLGAEGEETDMSNAARGFGAALRKRYATEVAYIDERLTSRVAESRFAEQRAAGARRRKDSDQVDAIAAQIICENWLQSRNGH